MKFRQTKLSNGLTVIGEQRDTAVSVAIGVFVKTGARDEQGAESGVSHFLEHMMFKGTEKRSALDITYEMGAIGAQANAFTSEENTVYYMAVLPEYFPTAVELLCDMLRPSLSVEEFDVEKKVILEEIALYQDRPTFVLFEEAMRQFFAGHPAGGSVLGTTQSISALSRDQMQQYFDRRYCAPNMVLAAAGNFDWDEFVAMAERYCGGWPPTPAPRECPEHVPITGEKTLTKKELQRAHVCLVAPGPAARDEERYAAGVLSCVLGDAVGSQVFWQLIDKGLADAASIDCEDMDGTGFVYGYASATPERIEEVTEILQRILSKPKDFDDEALARALTKMGTRLVLQGESSMRRLMAIGSSWLYREEYTTLQEELRRLQSVTRDDIHALLERFPLKPTAKVMMVPVAG